MNGFPFNGRMSRKQQNVAVQKREREGGSHAFYSIDVAKKFEKKKNKNQQQ